MKVLKNIIAILLGWVLGSAVNMSLINLGHSIFPVAGLDPENMESLAEIMPTLSAEYFIFPFLAHALGTFVGALIAGSLAVSYPMKFSLAIGGLFLIGGVLMSVLIPSPTWFTITDILIAYIPMALLGGKLALKFSTKRA